MSIRALLGVDEVGRGSLAGPVMVCAVWLPVGFDFKDWPPLRDSKVMTKRAREVVEGLARAARQAGALDYVVASRSATIIDRVGISPAIKSAVFSATQSLIKRQASRGDEALFDLYKVVRVELDGGLKAPKQFLHQTTIIKGDATQAAISLASIIAKVTRDRYMAKRGECTVYRQYGFATHKGYGTTAHGLAIRKYGLSDLHRRRFCRHLSS